MLTILAWNLHKLKQVHVPAQGQLKSQPWLGQVMVVVVSDNRVTTLSVLSVNPCRHPSACTSHFSSLCKVITMTAAEQS